MADPGDRHADHDPLLIASLLDRDLDGGERAVAESRIASCEACAALYADFVALSDATATLPTPPRPRAFTLTTADAARLRAPIAGEPSAPAPRLLGVTTDPGASAAHAAHDTMLVASLADDTLVASPERDAAEALVAGCSLCAALHVDLMALRSATRAMPTPVRPRDYTLTPDDAVRLRRAGWRRFVAVFGSSRDVFSRPLAVGLTTLGLAGLLVATVPSITSGLPGSSAAGGAEAVGAPIASADQAAPPDASGQGPAPTDASGQGAAAVAPVAAASPGGLSVAGAAASSEPGADGTDRFGTILTDRPSPTPGVAADTSGSAKGVGGAPGRSKELTGSTNLPVGHDTTGFSLLAILSGVFLIVGLGLFAIRWTARRFGD